MVSKKLMRFWILVYCLLCSIDLSIAARQISGSYTSFLSPKEALEEARSLVGILERDGQPVGASIALGLDSDCLYLATAEHVLKFEGDYTVKFRGSTNKYSVSQTEIVNNELDLAILCLKDAESKLVPFPKFSGARLGDSKSLIENDPLLIVGNSNTDWTSRSGRVINNTGEYRIEVVSDAERNDSGGGVFSATGSFYEVVGILVRENTVVKIDLIKSLLRHHGIPFQLTDWDFSEESVVSRNAALHLFSDLTGRGRHDRRMNDLNILSVEVDGGKFRKGRALLLGNDQSFLYFVVPSWIFESKNELRGTLFNGRNIKFIRIGEVDQLNMVGFIKAHADTGELIDMKLENRKDHQGWLNRPLESPYHGRLGRPAKLTPGAKFYYYGAKLAGKPGSFLSPSINKYVEENGDNLIVTSKVISAEKRGGILLNDRYQVLGLVTGKVKGASTFSVLKIDAIIDLAKSSGIPTKLTRAKQDWRRLETHINGFESIQTNPCWSYVLVSPYIDEFKAVTEINDERFALVGTSKIYHEGGRKGDSFILQTNENGSLGTLSFLNYPLDNRFLDITSINNGYVSIGYASVESDDYLGVGSSSVRVGFAKNNRAFGFLGDTKRNFRFQSVKSDSVALFYSGNLVQDNTNQGGMVRALLIEDDSELWSHIFPKRTMFEGLAVGSQSVFAGGSIVTKLPEVSKDVYIASLDYQNGEKNWIYTKKILKSEESVSDLVATARGVIAIGHKRDDFSKKSGYIFALDGDGILLWDNIVTAPGFDAEFRSIDIISSGLIVAGRLTNSTGNESYAWLAKFDLDGQLKWQKKYQPRYHFGRVRGVFNKVIADSSGKLIVVGGTESYGLQGNAWMLRLSQDGQLACKPYIN